MGKVAFGNSIMWQMWTIVSSISHPSALQFNLKPTLMGKKEYLVVDAIIVLISEMRKLALTEVK